MMGFNLTAVFAFVSEHPIIGQAFAGMAGGFVRSVTPPYASILESIANVMVGGLCAVYLSPLAIKGIERFTGIEVADQGSNLGAFLAGLGGITLTSYIIDAFTIARREQAKKESDDA